MSRGSPRKRPTTAADQPMALRQSGTGNGNNGLERGGVHELEAIIQAAPAAMFIAHDAECTRITRSRAANALPWKPPGADRPAPAVLDEPNPRCRLFRGVEELASPEALLQQAVGGTEVLGVELGLVFQDGGVTHLYGNAAPLLDEQGAPQGAVAVFMDVTELKHAYASMAAQVEEFSRSNVELEQFASTISHDLRSPLNAVSGCTQLLLEQHIGDLSPICRALIGDIQDSAREMNLLIKCLRDYARAGHSELKMTRCNADSALHAALKALQADVDRTAAQVTSDALPLLRADEVLLAQLLQNLIENAIKYRGTAPPRIHVSARDEPGYCIFSVSDNGIGIKPQDFDRIFRPFEQVRHTEAQCPSLGIGLAICKRIAERHGGRIWVDSQPGQGTTFSFSLARSD